MNKRITLMAIIAMVATATITGAIVIIKNKRDLEVHKATTPITITLPANSGYFSPAKYTF